MAVIAKALFNALLAQNVETGQYTTPSGTRTIIDKLSGYNTSAGVVTVTIKLIPSGGGAGASNTLAVKSFAVGEAYTFPEIVGHVLAPGDVLSTLASTGAAVAIRASGREVT
jgi:hypothetical protein